MTSNTITTRPKNKENLFIKQSSRTDSYLLVVTLLLVVIGLIMMYSASYIKAYSYGRSGLAYFTNQALYAGIGVTAMILISHINYRAIHTKSWPVWLFLVLSWILLFLTLFNTSASKRWLGVGDMFSFQPSELVKVAVIIFVSHISALNPERMKNIKYGFVQPVVVLALYVAIMALQPHYSGIIIVTVLMLVMMIIGGARWQWFVLMLVLIAIVALLLIFSDSIPDYVNERVTTWIGSGVPTHYQTEQSLIAIGSGGFNGLGLGNSRQKHHFLPEPQNDFLFAIVCEELGFRGALFVIGLFIYFVARGLSISLKAKDRFGALLAIGITIEIAMQAILNIAVVTDTIANTGISLPFFSQGGTSLIVLLAEVGLLLSIARYTNTDNRLRESKSKELEEV